jgi:diguanylate cyclase (GGDEF)-like protein
MSGPADAADRAEPLAAARAAASAARFPEAVERATVLFLGARDAGDWSTAAGAALVLARAHAGLKADSDAQRWAHEALQAAQRSAKADLECAAWVAVATEHARHERAAEAEQALAEVLRLMPSLQTDQALETALSGLTAVYSELGLTLRALPFARQALAVVEPWGQLARTSAARAALLVIGTTLCELLRETDPPASRPLLNELWPHLDRLRAEAGQLDSSLALARVHRVAGSLYNCEQRWTESLAEFEALKAYVAHLPPALACSVWIEQGLVQRQLGLLDAARASGEAAAACNPVPDPRRAVDLRRLALIEDLLGRPQSALELMRRYHDHRQYIAMSALESRVAALGAQAEGQGLRIENRALREQNASLTASVQQISALASTDPLTGLLNRRGFEAAWTLYAQSHRRRVLLLADLDHFKQVNDRFSHAVGDAVLRQVARLMQATLRGHDRIVRYGGEEFAALLLDVEPAPARAAVERLQEAIRSHDWSGIAAGLAVRISGGLVTVRSGESLDEAVHRADLLLYEAKRTGRDRVLEPNSAGA